MTQLWNLKYDTNELIYKTDSQTQKTNLWLPKGKGKDKLGVWDWQIQTTIYKINSKDLLYGTGNYTQYPVINHNGKKKKYIYLSHFAVYKKLMQHYKSTILQLKKFYFQLVKH